MREKLVNKQIPISEETILSRSRRSYFARPGSGLLTVDYISVLVPEWNHSIFTGNERKTKAGIFYDNLASGATTVAIPSTITLLNGKVVNTKTGVFLR